MAYYERRLPHWHPDSRALFVTWRLHGSLPAGIRLRDDETTPGKIFRAFDRVLDQAATGPRWLQDSRLAQLVVDALEFGETQQRLYKLDAYVVMANHVHVLLEPEVPLAKITRAIKGFTSRRANEILGRSRLPFWQEESYDHWVRNETEFQRIIVYIERNPVSAGLVQKSEDWRWSSAYRQARMPVVTLH